MSSMSIRKAIVGYIDMSKVIAVRGPFLDGHGDKNAWFEIDVQLRDEPIKFFHAVDWSSEVVWFDGRYEFVTTTPGQHYVRGVDVLTTVVGQKLQKTIDEFVAEWKEWGAM